MEPSPLALLSVVVPTRNSRDLTLACLAALRKAADPALEVLVVDDGGTDDTTEAVGRRFPEATVLRRQRSGGFSAAAGAGLAAARGDLLLLLNDDTEVDPPALAALRAAFAAAPRLGIAGAALRFPDGRPQWSGGREPRLAWLFALASGLPALLGRRRAYRRAAPVSGHRGDGSGGGGEVEWVTGAALGMRRAVWEEHQPFDAGFRFYAQDLDLCSRARRAGWKVAVVPGFTVVHHQGATIGRQAGAARGQHPELLWTDLLRWAAKHRGPRWAAAATRAMRGGLALRRLGRLAAGIWQPAASLSAWRAESAAYRAAARALRDFHPRAFLRGEAPCGS